MNIFSKPMTLCQFIKYIVPSILTMVFLSFYTTIDGYFVSKYAGSAALAGINIVVPITCIIFGTSVMLATGAGAIIGEHMGRKEHKEANKVFSSISLALLVFSVLFSILGILFLKPISIFLGASDKLLPYVMPYAFVVFAGTIPMAFKLFFEYLVRTDGNPQVGLEMSVTGLILNLVLDYLFVGVFKLGTFGAALGTVLSISVSAVIGLIYFLRRSTVRFCKTEFNTPVFFKSCANGSSEMLTELSTGITTLLFNLIIMQQFGEDGVAAVTIVMYIYYFFIAFYMGIAVAAAPVVSYNLGSGNSFKIRETVKYSFIVIGVTAVLIMLILHLLGDNIIGLFARTRSVFELTSTAMKYFSPVFLFIGINVFLSAYFTALGDGFTSAIISSLRSLIFVIIFIFTLPRLAGINGVWLTMPYAEISTLLVSIVLFSKKGKKYLYA